jgi:hypothetical protein
MFADTSVAKASWPPAGVSGVQEGFESHLSKAAKKPGNPMR